MVKPVVLEHGRVHGRDPYYTYCYGSLAEGQQWSESKNLSKHVNHFLEFRWCWALQIGMGPTVYAMGTQGIKGCSQDDYVELKAIQEAAMDSDFTAFHPLESSL